VGNRIPLNTNFNIELLGPSGFVIDKKGSFHPGVKILLLNTRRDTLVYIPNIFGKNTATGFNKAQLKKLTATLGYTAKLHTGDTVLQYISFFDTRSKNKLLLEFPVIISDLPDSMLTCHFLSTASGTAGYQAAATNGIQLKNVEAFLDSIYFPQKFYHSIRLAEITGLALQEAEEGSHYVWLYDENMQEIKIAGESNQYIAKTFRDKEGVNILIQIPINARDPKNKKYTARYRWVSADGKKLIDVVNRFENW
jgi:hypothetical protein